MIGKLLMCGERFLEKETLVSELEEQQGFVQEWEDGVITEHSRSWLATWWPGNVGVG